MIHAHHEGVGWGGGIKFKTTEKFRVEEGEEGVIWRKGGGGGEITSPGLGRPRLGWDNIWFKLRGTMIKMGRIRLELGRIWLELGRIWLELGRI